MNNERLRSAINQFSRGIELYEVGKAPEKLCSRILHISLKRILREVHGKSNFQVALLLLFESARDKWLELSTWVRYKTGIDSYEEPY